MILCGMLVVPIILFLTLLIAANSKTNYLDEHES